MIVSKQMREYFVSDNGLPIQILDDPYFPYYIRLLDPYYDSIKKYNMFIDAISETGGEDKLIEVTRKFRNDVIQYVENLPSYNHFMTDMVMPQPVTTLNKSNLYQLNNVGLYFTSMDLVEANFQALKFMCPKEFEWKDYESFAKTFTNIPYCYKCKKTRQIIFGLLCPQRQQTVQKYIISVFKKSLMETLKYKETDFISTSSDEIVYRTEYYNELGNSKDLLEECLIHGIEGIRLRTNVFKLTLEGTDKYGFFTKLYLDNKREIKQVDSAYIPEVIKFLEKREVDPEFDRLFIRDDRLCHFKESLF